MDISTLARDVAQILVAQDTARLPEAILDRIKHGHGDIVSVIGRPGTGGRNLRLPAGTNTEATAELLKVLGPPEIVRRGIARLNWWEVDPSGDGAIVARLSSRDENKGETVRAQILGAREMCQRLGLRPRYVLEATNQSGKSSIDNRLDLQFLIAAIRRNELSWLSYREVDRLARSSAVGATFREFLEEFEVDLYLTDMGRKMDWEVDSFLLTALGGVAEHERRLIMKRTSTALKRRWLEEGRGWPASQRFGFRRNSEKFLEVDPDQWPLVQRIHTEYSRVGETGQGSLTRLKDLMAELKCPISREGLRRILTDSIYSTGEWGVTHQGTYYPSRKIEMADPIPGSLMASNQALLENTKGSYRRTPFGAFMLNTVDVFHARCMTTDDDEGSPKLRARNYFDRRESRPHTYLHSGGVPTQCRGYAVPADHLEKAVIDVLLGLAGSKALQIEYLAAASTEIQGPMPTEDVPSLKRRISTLRRNRAKLLRDFTESVVAEGTGGAGKTSDLIEALDAEIDACAIRVELAKPTPDRSFKDPTFDLRAALEQVLMIKRDASDQERRRRVLLVGALVSRIVVHDEHDGTYVEVFGHLIPQGHKAFSEDLTLHFEHALSSSHKPSSKRSTQPTTPETATITTCGTSGE